MGKKPLLIAFRTSYFGKSSSSPFVRVWPRASLAMHEENDEHVPSMARLDSPQLKSLVYHQAEAGRLPCLSLPPLLRHAGAALPFKVMLAGSTHLLYRKCSFA